MKRNQRCSGDDGVVLVIALITVTVVALVLAGLLSLSGASERNTRTTRDYEAKVYAADAGIDYAIQTLKRDNTICADPSIQDDIAVPQINPGTTVTVHCRTFGGLANNAAGYAVIVTDGSSNSFTTQSGGLKTVEGPVYLNGLPGSLDITVKNGDVFGHKSSCSSPADGRPSSLVFLPANVYGYFCTTDPIPSVAHQLPTVLPPPMLAVGDTTTVPGCTIFRPGTYPSAPVLGKRNYFASGVYYFQNVGTIDVSKAEVVAGKRGSVESYVTSASACASDSDVPGSTGTGAEFILGGNSAISVGNQGALEVFARQGGPASEGTKGFSIHSVQSGEATGVWTGQASSLGAGTDIVAVGNGSKGELAIHGTAYTPNARINTFATNTSKAQFQGGIVTGRLNLQNSSSSTGLVVSVNTADAARQIVLTSTATGQGRNVVSSTVLTITSNSSRSVALGSWQSDKR